MECVKADEGVGSFQILPEIFSSFQELMAIATKRVLETFDDNKRFYLNYALQITAHCDCMGFSQPVVIPEIGLLASRDIVAVEMATLDLIAQAGLIEQAIPPYFKHTNLDPKADLHPFQRLWGEMKNPYLVIDFAEKHGLGQRDYELVEVLSPEKTGKMKPPKHVYERQPSFY
jgi:uncharacterized Fe-S center protein